MLTSALADRYGLDVHDLAVVCRGVNVTFRVLAKEGVFYLRLYRLEGRSPAEIAVELRALLGFPATDALGVAKPRPLQTGALFFPCAYDGQIRYAALFEAAPGEQPEATPENLCRFAEALATLQRAMGPDPIKRPFDPGGIINSAVDSLAELGPDFASIRDQIELASAEVLLAAVGPWLTFGFCHGDAWLGNVRFHGGLTTFIDFDECHHGPVVGDVARLLRTVWDDQQAAFIGLAPGILDAYRKASGVDPGEFRAIPPLARLGEIAALGFLARYCTMDESSWALARKVCAQRLDDWSPEGEATTALLRALEGIG